MDECFVVEIIKHDLSTRTKGLTISQAHKGKVSGITYGQNSENVLSCGVDRNVKLWDSEGKVSALVRSMRIRSNGLE